LARAILLLARWRAVALYFCSVVDRRFFANMSGRRSMECHSPQQLHDVWASFLKNLVKVSILLLLFKNNDADEMHSDERTHFLDTHAMHYLFIRSYKKAVIVHHASCDAGCFNSSLLISSTIPLCHAPHARSYGAALPSCCYTLLLR
jgi:hypothetical protein